MGKWTRVNNLSGQPYHIVCFVPGVLQGSPNNQMLQWTCPSGLSGGVTFAANFGGNARGWLQANPTATATIQLYKVAAGSSAGTTGTNIGSISISTSGVFTFTLASPVSFAAGDSLTAFSGASADATLAGVGFTLVGTR